MDTKNKHAKNKKLPIVLAMAVVILLAGVVAGFIFKDEIKAIATDVVSSIENKDKPKFTFNTNEFPDWVTSGNTFHNDNQDGSQHTAMLIDQCQAGSDCSSLMDDSLKADKCETTSKQQCEKLQLATDAGACMVHLYHFNYTIKPDEAITDYLNSNTEFEKAGFKVTTSEIDVKTLSMNTPEGDKTYKLHQYNSDNKSGDYKSGVSLGYIPLKNSHIEIKGICDNSDQLDEVLPILNAVRLEF